MRHLVINSGQDAQYFLEKWTILHVYKLCDQAVYVYFIIIRNFMLIYA